MARFLSLTAIAAAMALAPAAYANEDPGEASKADAGTPVKLIEFDGAWEVLKTSAHLRIWRSHLAYKISVDAEGNPTGCELTEKFRRTYVKKTLCSVLLKHHRFEPARDASDVPIAGSYSARLSYLDMREHS